ncbi:MAG: rhodanese-like domain-containing protein [Candidatus Zixiibacteriota bacterium]
MKLKFTGALLLASMLFIGCSGSGLEDGRHPDEYESVTEMVNEARIGIEEITADELRKKLDANEEIFLVDVRTQSEYDEDYIGMAINIPRGILEFNIGIQEYWDRWAMYAPQKDSEIIIYCKKGDRSALAADAIKKLGYKNVKNLRGGWLVWKHGPDALEMEEAKASGGGCG